MTTYTTFLSIHKAKNLPSTARVLNVVDYQEQPYEWRGRLGRAFDGTLISTLHTPKRSARCTVEFASGADLETFLTLIGASRDATRGVITGLDEMQVLDLGSDSATRANASGFRCLVQVGALTPTDRIVAGNIQRPSWTAELTFLEV